MHLDALDKRVLKKIHNSILYFVLYVLEAKPTNQQKEVLNSIDRGDTKITIRSGHGTGKSAMLSWIVLWVLLTKYDAKSVCTAPAGHQLYDILFPEIKKWSERMPEHFQNELKITTDKIYCANKNFAAARTARKESPEALQGFHGTTLLFILDEASGIDNAVFEVSEGALTGDNSLVVMTGNPTRTEGYFYESHNKHSKYWTCHHFNAEDSENVNNKWVAQMEEKYGRDSDIYRVRVLGEFPQASKEVLIPFGLIDEAMDSEKTVDESGTEVWGVDVARFGDDASVIWKRKGRHAYEKVKKYNKDTMELADIIMYEYNNHDAETKPIIFVDTIGIGAGVFDRLRTHIGNNAQAADVTRRSADPRTANKRSEMYMRLLEELKLGMKIKKDDDLLADLSSVYYEFNKSGKIKLRAKDWTKKELGRSPDDGDALALTFYAPVSAVTESVVWNMDIEIPEMAAGW